jgi:hypothetical protein
MRAGVRRTAPLVAFLALVCVSAPAAAQCLPTPAPPEFAQPCREHYPRWTGELASLGVNSLLGALSGGILQELHGGSFSDGFMRGAAGGSVIYVAKRVVAGEFYGAGLAGRQLGAVGSSIVRNAGLGKPSLSEIVLPIGIARIYVTPSKRAVRVIPDMTAIAWTISGIQNHGLHLDLEETISAGTPMFFSDNQILVINNDSAHVGGLTNSGVVFLADVPAFGSGVARINNKHERVHVIQEDQIFLTVTDPFEDWAIQKAPVFGPFLSRHVDINLATSLLNVLSNEMPKFLNRPWETEAVFRAR